MLYIIYISCTMYTMARLGGALHRAKSSGLPWLTVARPPGLPIGLVCDLHWLGNFPATNGYRLPTFFAYFRWYFPIETPPNRGISGLLKNQKVCIYIYIYIYYLLVLNVGNGEWSNPSLLTIKQFPRSLRLAPDNDHVLVGYIQPEQTRVGTF